MKKSTRHALLIIALLAICLFSCAPTNHYETGKQSLATGNHADAIVQFELALLGEEAVDDHICSTLHWELARLYDERPETRLRALVHYQEVLNGSLPEGITKSTAENALRTCELAVYMNLQKALGGDATERTLRQKLSLLEDHARQQSIWLKELRDENERLLRKLSTD